MRTLLTVAFLLVAEAVFAQTPPVYPLYPAGMRVITGGSGALPRNTPDLNGMCGTPPHACTVADALAPNVYGVVQSDTPVQDAAGWWWLRIIFETGLTGWATAYPPYINALSPPQMVQGSSFRIIGDYIGPVLTGALCINDGINSNAVMALQPGPSGQQGTLQCTWTTPGVGNHIQVITAVNTNGSTPSSEFQFQITTAPIPPKPSAPMNLRINPLTGPPVVTTAKPPVK